jgi:cytochrome c biogenesis protein CcmG/thiol:disulfide interchange protein DsbE
VLTVGILLAAVALVLVWMMPKDTAPCKGKIGCPAPELVLKDLNGATVNLADLKGKVVLVDFWATWCQPCTVMIPWFIEFQKRYGPQGFVVVGVAMDDEGISVVKPFAEQVRMNYQVVLGNEETSDKWGGIFGLPTSFIIDREGRIHNRHIGLISKETFEKDIRSLL